jgi:hypothetical protein
MTVNGTEQIHPPARNPNVGLIHMPGCRFIFHISFEPLVDDRSVRLAPTPHRRVVDDEAPFPHEFFDITQAQGKPQIPANTGDDNFWLKVASTEEGRSVLLHSVTLKTLPAALQHFAESSYCDWQSSPSSWMESDVQARSKCRFDGVPEPSRNSTSNEPLPEKVLSRHHRRSCLGFAKWQASTVTPTSQQG